MSKGQGWHGNTRGHAAAGRAGGLKSAAARRARRDERLAEEARAKKIELGRAKRTADREHPAK